jgi:cyclic pyranopterin phosphate synthase
MLVLHARRRDNEETSYRYSSLEKLENIARAAVKLGITKIRLTGGEPLVRRGITDLIRNIAKIPGLKDLALTTNGILLKDYAEKLKEAGLDRLNISIDTLDKEKYAAITRGGKLEDVLEGIKAAKEAGLKPIKINTVLIKGFNDEEIIDFVNMTIEEDIEVRFIELMPMGEVVGWDESYFLSNSEVLKKVPDLMPLLPKEHDSVSRSYKVFNSKGRVGLISPISNHFCNYCNRIRITPDGKIKPCLHSDLEIDINNYGENEMEKFLLDGIKAKPYKHNILSKDFTPVGRNMNQIGG